MTRLHCFLSLMSAYLSIRGRWLWRPTQPQVHYINCLSKLSFSCVLIVHAITHAITTAFIVARIQLLIFQGSIRLTLKERTVSHGHNCNEQYGILTLLRLQIPHQSPLIQTGQHRRRPHWACPSPYHLQQDSRCVRSQLDSGLDQSGQAVALPLHPTTTSCGLWTRSRKGSYRVGETMCFFPLSFFLWIFGASTGLGDMMLRSVLHRV